MISFSYFLIPFCWRLTQQTVAKKDRWAESCLVPPQFRSGSRWDLCYNWQKVFLWFQRAWVNTLFAVYLPPLLKHLLIMLSAGFWNGPLHEKSPSARFSPIYLSVFHCLYHSALTCITNPHFLYTSSHNLKLTFSLKTPLCITYKLSLPTVQQLLYSNTALKKSRNALLAWVMQPRDFCFTWLSPNTHSSPSH